MFLCCCTLELQTSEIFIYLTLNVFLKLLTEIFIDEMIKLLCVNADSSELFILFKLLLNEIFGVDLRCFSVPILLTRERRSLVNVSYLGSLRLPAY
jgi:hypothetical protein